MFHPIFGKASMKKIYIFLLTIFSSLSFAAVQYEFHGNQGWLEITGEESISSSIGIVSLKDGTQENFIDRGGSWKDYGWYNLESKETGSFLSTESFKFSDGDKIGFWVKDNSGQIYTSTKTKSEIFSNSIWGKSKMIDGGISLGGGDFGSNGTHEFYVFQIKTIQSDQKPPTGQPLPGIIFVLIFGAAFLVFIR